MNSLLGVPNTPSATEKKSFGVTDRQRKELTDIDKTEMETARTQQKEKFNAFIQTLSEEQKVLYEAMMPTRIQSIEGEKPQRSNEVSMTAMKEKQEDFVASLTASQKAAYDELYGNAGRTFKQPSDTEKADMEALRTQREENPNAFIQTLSEGQKTLF